MSEENIPERLKAVEVTQESHEQRLNEHGKQIDTLRISVEHYHAATDEKLDRLNETTSRIDRRLEDNDRKLEEERQRPADNWREFVKQVLTYILAITLALMASRIGLG